MVDPIPLPRHRRLGGHVDSGGDGPHDSDMEVRVAKLEEGFADIKRDTQRLVLDVGNLLSKVDDLAKGQAELRGKVSNLPTTMQLILFVLAVLGIAGVTKLFG